MSTESTSAHGEGALCSRLHHHPVVLEPVFVGVVQNVPGSTGPAWKSKPAEVGLLPLPFFPLLPGSVSRP